MKRQETIETPGQGLQRKKTLLKIVEDGDEPPPQATVDTSQVQRGATDRSEMSKVLFDILQDFGINAGQNWIKKNLLSSCRSPPVSNRHSSGHPKRQNPKFCDFCSKMRHVHSYLFFYKISEPRYRLKQIRSDVWILFDVPNVLQTSN